MYFIIIADKKPWDYFDCDPKIIESWPQVPKDMPRFDTIKCPTEAKNIIIGRYPPDRRTGERPKICPEEGDSKTNQFNILSRGLEALGNSQERGLKALADSKSAGTEKDPIDLDIDDVIYTITFARDIYKTTYATENKNQKMSELMIEVQKDRGSGVFDFNKADVRRLKTNVSCLKFSPSSESKLNKKICYSLHNFNKMSVLQFSKSVKDTDICITITIEDVYKTPSNESSPLFKIWN